MKSRSIPSTSGYDIFKAAVTFVLLFAVLIAVAINSGITQAAEPAQGPTPGPVIDLPPTISDSAVIAGCIEVSGTGNPGTELRLVAGSSTLGSVAVGEDSTWSLTTCVDPGDYRLVAVSIDDAGAELNRSASFVVLVPEPTSVPTPVPDATLPPTPEPTEAAAGDGQEYIVQQGDWLIGLARAFYGDDFRWEDIFNATNAKAAEDPSFATITNPNELVPGWKIWIPLP